MKRIVTVFIALFLFKSCVFLPPTSRNNHRPFLLPYKPKWEIKQNSKLIQLLDSVSNIDSSLDIHIILNGLSNKIEATVYFTESQKVPKTFFDAPPFFAIATYSRRKCIIYYSGIPPLNFESIECPFYKIDKTNYFDSLPKLHIEDSCRYIKATTSFINP